MAVIREAEQLIRKGGIIIFPTRNLYGLGADAFNLKAIERVFQIKRRPIQKPVSILIKSRVELDFLVEKIPAAALKLMDAFWPGRITIIFKAGAEVPSMLTAGTGKIGIRLPEHPVAAALVNALDHPITATSANLSGTEGAHRIQGLPEDLIKDVSLILDVGALKSGRGSTVVDVTVDPPVVLREGEVPEKEIFAI